jgi:hypothetical protein
MSCVKWILTRHNNYQKYQRQFKWHTNVHVRAIGRRIEFFA